ncbi:hypothetical protein [Kitasatospora indigofera]|nr:hypothetical protein [Kitasatospora indigofera]
MSVGWVGLVALGPWLLKVFHFANDLGGVTVLLAVLMLGVAPTLLFGFTLGRVQAWPFLMVSAVSGAVVLLIEFAAFSDPNLKTQDPMPVFVVSYLLVLLLFIEFPLAGGVAVGVMCRSCRNGGRH